MYIKTPSSIFTTRHHSTSFNSHLLYPSQFPSTYLSMTCKSIPIHQRNFLLSQSLLNFLFVMYKYHWVRRHWSRHYHHFPLPYKGISSTTHHQHHLIHFINHSMTLFFIASKRWFLSPNFTFHAIPTILIIRSFLYWNKNSNYHLHFCFTLPKTLFNTLL